jgi:hypothetical protein
MFIFDQIVKLYRKVFMTDTVDHTCRWLYNKPKFDAEGYPSYNRKRVGYIVAIKDEFGIIKLGWSRCSNCDVWDQDLAKQIAWGRVYTGTATPIPSSFKEVVPDFILQAKRHFQTDKIYDVVYSR